MPRSLALALVAALLPIPLGAFLVFAWWSAPSPGLLTFLDWIYAPIATLLFCVALVACCLTRAEERRTQRGLHRGILGLLAANVLVAILLYVGPGSASSVSMVHIENLADDDLLEIVVEAHGTELRLDRLGPGESVDWPVVPTETGALILRARKAAGLFVHAEAQLDANLSTHVAFRVGADGIVAVDRP